jgi:hypothetical protein
MPFAFTAPAPSLEKRNVCLPIEKAQAAATVDNQEQGLEYRWVQ